MTTYYSDNFSATSGATSPDRSYIVPSSRGGSFRPIMSGKITGLMTTSDLGRVIRNVPSSTIVWGLRASANDASAAGAFDIGVHDTEENGGAAVDADRFATAVAKNADRAEAFTESTTLKPTDRGKPLWQLLGLSADSKKSYDITVTPSTTFTTTAITILLELEIDKP